MPPITTSNHYVPNPLLYSLKQSEAMNDHVRELKIIVDQCKTKQIDADALIQKLESKNSEI